jgi:SAM-dependent methyltransferase
VRPAPAPWSERLRFYLRWRRDNARARATWHVARGREWLGLPGRDVYDGAFWNYHERGDWDAVARTILGEAPARSVLDVGCGAATLLAAFSRTSAGIRTLGLEHSPAGRARAAAAGVNVRDFDAARLDRISRIELRRQLGDFDLVMCLEVAEHLPPRHGDRLVLFLASWPRVLFSAAQPNQGGTLHVNEQPIAYWVRRFAGAGMEPSPCSARLRERLAAAGAPWWYSRNIVLFEQIGQR